MLTRRIAFTVNGRKTDIEVDIRESLLEVLRNRLHLTGAKQGCSVGECGACTVLIDGENFDSCIYLAVWADGKEIRTIEGEARGARLSGVQQAFVDEGAIQCGFCTPGLVMTATALAESGRAFTGEEIRKELSGHMCRCTGYHNIVKAAEKILADPGPKDGGPASGCCCACRK